LRPDTAPPAIKGTFHIPALDGLRAVAVMLVFIGHANLPTVVGAGTGVTVFFFLSGYLITTLLRREHAQTGRVSVRDFYLRRALRILPPMYVFLIVAMVLTATGVVAGRITWAGIAAAVLQYSNFIIVFGDSSDLIPGTGVLWSLAIEEHFYLVFPLLYVALLTRLSRKSQGAAIAVLCAAALVWRCVLVYWLGGDYDRAYYGTDTRVDSLLGGCLLAVVANPMLDRVKVRPARSLAVVVAGGLLVIAGEQLPGLLAATVGPTVQVIGLGIVFTAILSTPRSAIGRLLDWRPMAKLGVLSYSFYLFHALILTVVREHLGLGTAATALLAFIVTLAVCQAVHMLVEQPLARVRRRLTHQRPSTASLVA
jgi:peptidoglycan/LPS O-acetylase OafA/YrhL